METGDEILHSKFAGALIGTMAGDAVGATVEGDDGERLRERLDGLPFLDAPARALQKAILGLISGGEVQPGLARYTDDTQMTIGVAESLVAFGGFDVADMAARFAENLEVRRGYGLGAQIVLTALRNGAAWNEAAQGLFGGKGSWGNGAAMRVAPVGVFYHDRPDELRRVADLSATITHTHPLGRQGAIIQAAAVAAATRWNDSDPFDAETFLDEVREGAGSVGPEYESVFGTIELLLQVRPEPDEIAETLGASIEAHRSVPAALYSFMTHPQSFYAAVTYAVRLGGDTDTVGAMTGAISGAFHGVEAIPAPWLAALENGAKGRDYLRTLADSLYARWRGDRP